MQKQTSGVAALSATTEDDPELSDNVYPGRFKRKLSAPTVSSHRVNDGIEWVSCYLHLVTVYIRSLTLFNVHVTVIGIVQCHYEVKCFTVPHSIMCMSQ